jgi:hypothetical protein
MPRGAAAGLALLAVAAAAACGTVERPAEEARLALWTEREAESIARIRGTPVAPGSEA